METQEQQSSPMTAPRWKDVTIADGLFGFVLLTAAVLRLANIASIPLSPDEAREALAVWRFLQTGGNVLEPLSPAYFSITSMLAALLGTSEAVMRLTPALFGLGLVSLPRFMRRELRPKGYLVAAVLLALSPVNVLISRTVGGDAIALFGVLLLALCLPRAALGGQQRWLYGTMCALAIGSTSSPLFYSGALVFLLAWWAQRRFDADKTIFVRPTRGTLTGPLITGIVLFLALSTRLLTYPAGIGAAARILSDWLGQFGWQNNLALLLAPYEALIRYETLLVLMGVIAMIWALWQRSRFGVLLSYWLLSGLLLFLVHQGVVSNVLLLATPGALLLGRFSAHILAKRSGKWTWFLTSVLALAGLAVVTNIGRFLRVVPFEQNPIYLWTTLLILAGVALAIYTVWSIDESGAWQGIWLSALILLLFYQWGHAWHLAQTAANDPREPWTSIGADDDVRVLLKTVTDISRQVTNSDTEIPLLSAVDSTVLRWYFRDFTKAQFGETVIPGTESEIVITSAEEGQPLFGSDYLGADYALLRMAGQPEESATPFLDSLRWLLFRESSSPVQEQRVILWVRADLAQPE